MSAKKHLKIINRYVTRMPSLSTTVTKVLEICNRQETSPRDLNRVISYDPVLTGQLLKLVNSAYYSLSCKITSLTRAIIMLGINTVKNMALSTSILAGMKSKRITKLVDIDAFWAHSLCVGVTAKAIAKEHHVTASNQESYFVAGLMHDLGKIPMMASIPELYHQCVELSLTNGRPILEAEQILFGLDHCQVGSLIGAKWKLGPELKPVISGHHRVPDQRASTSSHWLYVAIANQLTNQLAMGSPEQVGVDSKLFADLLVQLGQSAEDLFRLEPTIMAELEKAKVFLQVIQ